MIVNTESKISYLGDGATTAFPIPFKFSDTKDVKLILYDAATDTERRIESDYYVDSAAAVLYYPGYAPGQEPGNAARPPVAPIGTKLYIYRETPINQLVDMGEKYPLPIIEAMNDKLTFIAQEMSEELSRCVKTEMSSDISLGAVVIKELYESRDKAVASAAAAELSVAKAEQQAQAAAYSVTQAQTYAAASAGSATAAANSVLQAATQAQAAAAGANEAERQAGLAAANVQSAIDASREARQHMLDAADSANDAKTSKDGAEYWAGMANTYVEPLRNALLQSMFEYDTNADLMIVENPLTAASTMWEVDTDGDVMPM